MSSVLSANAGAGVVSAAAASSTVAMNVDRFPGAVTVPLSAWCSSVTAACITAIHAVDPCLIRDALLTEHQTAHDFRSAIAGAAKANPAAATAGVTATSTRSARIMFSTTTLHTYSGHPRSTNSSDRRCRTHPGLGHKDLQNACGHELVEEQTSVVTPVSSNDCGWHGKLRMARKYRKYVEGPTRTDLGPGCHQTQSGSCSGYDSQAVTFH